MRTYIYPVTIKLSDAKVKRQGYKLALLVGGGYLCCGTIFQKYPTTQRFAGGKVKRQLYKIALFEGGGHFSVSLNFLVTGYIYES